MKICPHDPTHKEFITTGIEYHDWVVDGHGHCPRQQGLLRSQTRGSRLEVRHLWRDSREKSADPTRAVTLTPTKPGQHRAFLCPMETNIPTRLNRRSRLTRALRRSVGLIQGERRGSALVLLTVRCICYVSVVSPFQS